MDLPIIFATKYKMTAVYLHNKRLPVTRLKAFPLHVVQIKTAAKDGYQAIQVAFGQPKKHYSKPQLGHLKKAFAKPPYPRYLREIKVADVSPFKVGDKLNIPDIITVGDIVQVQGVTKGKGFTGTIKRWGFARQPKTHGQSDRTRAPGSIGQTTGVGRVFKGKKMAGRHGHLTHTVKNSRVVYVAPDGSEIWLTGHMPGQPGGVLKIQKTDHQDIKTSLVGLPHLDNKPTKQG